MAYHFFALWYEPQNYPTTKISNFVTLMIFEFVMVHSGIFMAFMPKRLSLFIFVPFYGVFALIFNSFVENDSILIIYLIAVFNRMRFAFSDVSSEIKGQAAMRSVFSAFAYFVLIFVVLIFQSYIPHLGLTPDFLNYSGYFNTINATGNFVESPHIAICFGVIYYLVLACVEYYLLPVGINSDDDTSTKKKIKEKLKYTRLMNKKKRFNLTFKNKEKMR